MTAHRIRVGVAVSFMGLALTAGTASAQVSGCSFSCGPEGVEQTPAALPATGEVTVVVPVAAPQIQPAAETAPTSSGTLPFTGGDVAGMVVIGAAALGAGTIMVRRTRKAG